MLKKFGLLFLMLGLPAIIYLVYVNIAENNYQKLPVFGPKEAFFVTEGQKYADTAYTHLLPLQKQLERLENKVMVVSYFVPGDLTNNRLRYRQLARVEDVFKENPLIWLLNMHVKSDSLLPTYEGKPYPKRLSFASEENRMVNELEQALMVYMPDWKAVYPETDLRELSFLVDKQLRVRGFYKTVLRKETDRLMEDIRTLVVEYANTEPKRRRK
ncbi:MAG: hypothetical protein ACK417_11400 [Bacteroidia bacterium]